MLDGMAKFKLLVPNNPISEYVGTYTITDGGVLSVEPEKDNPFVLSPSAWLMVEVIEKDPVPAPIAF
jgi:hypothetical protein